MSAAYRLPPWALVGLRRLLLLACFAGALGHGTAVAVGQAVRPGTQVSEPVMLDLSAHFWERFVTATRTNHSFSGILGRRIIDDLPFQVDGRACLFGKCQTNFARAWAVPAGRAFEELHVLHATQWSDLEGQTIAWVRLNYADGTRHEFPIKYGVQVRDWQRLQSEEKEVLTDPDSKVIWRGPGIPQFGSTQRMFKSRMVNPFPAKVVTTIEFVSAAQIASYDVAAVTLASRDPNRPVTAAIPLDGPERHFDGEVKLRVEDRQGRPVPGVWVYPNINVQGTGAATVATPFYTPASGEGIVRYPRNSSACFVFSVHKDGWLPEGEEVRWHRLGPDGQLPGGPVVVIRMIPDPSAQRVPDPAGSTNNALLAADPQSHGTAATIVSSPGSTPPRGEVPTLRSCPILMIDFPAGSTVRVEATDQLQAPDWHPLTIITNLPYSPYPYVCGNESPPRPQRFYRSVRLP